MVWHPLRSLLQGACHLFLLHLCPRRLIQPVVLSDLEPSARRIHPLHMSEMCCL
ncbi:hypothetical protein MIZ03_0864 [Rhodoferax lithotrophicus]|uniref:Uncharacterized protein n=1 Tax=Rhodoferax lithotrophicus TaxID=2798804 RepID=A0ABM7MIG7_9BURK|nr:hypothetical protein MIZ03_0864 [Rhodoferax sp. MIZ03]